MYFHLYNINKNDKVEMTIVKEPGSLSNYKY